MGRGYEVQIEIENKCYLDCIHCSSLSMRNSEPIIFREEELINFFQLFDVPLHIYFTGGEPLANPNLMTLIKLVKTASPLNSVGIFTSGVLIDNTSIDRDFAHKLKMIGLEDCYISLYHCDSEKHDLITNLKGSYNATLKSINNLINNKIDVKVHLVVNSYNYEELDRIINNILKLGVNQVRILRIVKTGAAEYNWGTVGVSYAKQNAAIKEIIESINKYSGKVTISGFPTEIACRPTPQAIKCQAGTHLLYITNSKQVYPCACTKGNPSFLIAHISDSTKLKQYINQQQDYFCNEECLNPIH